MASEWEELVVRDTLRDVPFLGKHIAPSTSKRALPSGLTWYDLPATLSLEERMSYVRWTEMELYKVAPGQDDPEGRIALPDGGYFWLLIGESLVYHKDWETCEKGVPHPAAEVEVDMVPCPVCQPPRLWEYTDGADPETARLLTDPDLEVYAESTSYTLHRNATAAGIIAQIEGRKLSRPAAHLLEVAMRRDPAFAAHFARPAPPRSVA